MTSPRTWVNGPIRSHERASRIVKHGKTVHFIPAPTWVKFKSGYCEGVFFEAREKNVASPQAGAEPMRSEHEATVCPIEEEYSIDEDRAEGGGQRLPLRVRPQP